jgi:RPA family protein
MSGAAGTTTLKFSANPAAGRTATLKVNCGDQTQEINVIQGIAEVQKATCAEVIAGADAKTYLVTGVCKAIANTQYGNWYLDDGTGEIYIYGTVDASGNYNWASFGIEVGDEVTVQGPKTTYGSTVELVDVSVVKVNKSLIKVDSLMIGGVKTSDALPIEGGDIFAAVTCKGDGINVDIPADAKDWLFISAITSKGITFRALPNTGGDRSTVITFKTYSGKKEYTSQVTISQKGAILEVPIADFLAAEVGNTQFRMTGIITELYASDKQGKSFYIADYSGKTLVYRAEGFIEAGAKVGDVVTVVGKRGAYKDSPQMVEGTFEELKYAVTQVSIADFRAKADDKETYYMISGVVSQATEEGTKNDVEKYGNFNLTDETGSVYIYGVTEGWGGPKGSFGNLGVNFGDKLTIIAYKTSYKGMNQGVGMYFSHESAE